MIDICDDCSGPADGPGDSERVDCDCGDVVCSTCCVSFDGESYCRECAEALQRHHDECELCNGKESSA